MRWTSDGRADCADGSSTACSPEAWPGQLVTVSLPALSAEAPCGIKVVPQSTAAITEEYQRTTQPDGKELFELSDFYEHGPQDGETDVTALAEGYITVTPLHADLTDYGQLSQLQQCHWPDTPE